MKSTCNKDTVKVFCSYGPQTFEWKCFQEIVILPFISSKFNKNTFCITDLQYYYVFNIDKHHWQWENNCKIKTLKWCKVTHPGALQFELWDSPIKSKTCYNCNYTKIPSVVVPDADSFTSNSAMSVTMATAIYGKPVHKRHRQKCEEPWQYNHYH